MSTLAPGDPVIARDGDYQGQLGYVVSVYDASETYHVLFTDENGIGVFDDLTDDQLVRVEITDEEETEPPPSFGMTEREYHLHVKYILEKSLDRMMMTGPKEAFFGFQEFEGKDARELLADFLVKIEEALAIGAQAHILVGRMLMALQAWEQNDRDE